MREGMNNCKDISVTASWCHLKVEVRGSDGDYLPMHDAIDTATKYLREHKDPSGGRNEWQLYDVTLLNNTAWIVVFTAASISDLRASGRVTCS